MRSSHLARRSSGPGRGIARAAAPARPRSTSASSAGKRVIIDEKGHQDGRARHDTELARSLELGEHEHEERAGRGEGAEQHARPRALGRPPQRAIQAHRRRALLLVAVEEVDAVVDADARSTMEMNITEKMLRWPTTRVMIPIDQARLTASVPSMSTDFPTRRKASSKSAEGGRERQHGGQLAVVEGRGHLVAGDGGPAGHSRLHVRDTRHAGWRWLRGGPSIVSRFSPKLRSSRSCRTNRKSSRRSDEKK